jgi:hypothetical protein
MNNASQAQHGFKTFILTLSISLIVFSIAYYFVSESQPGVQLGFANKSSSTQLLASSSKAKTDADKKAAQDSVFSKLADSKVSVPQRAVLAGATTTTGTTGTTGTTATGTTTATTVTTTATTPVAKPVAQTTTSTPVPTTGSTEMTIGLVLSALAFGFGLFVISKNPRKLALDSFEKRMRRGL